MADEEILHIAVAPPVNLDANLVGNVSTVINKRPYDTRLLLAGEIPKIIAHYSSVETAESVMKKLQDLGLAVIALKDSELHQSSQSFKVHTLEFGGGEVLFRDRNGHEKRIDENNVFLILEGRIQSIMKVGTVKTTTKLSLTGTLLMGGIPIRRKVEEKTITQSSQIEYFIRVYERISLDSCIEMLRNHMDYSFLGAQRAATSAINFGTVVQKLRETFPQAIFDNRMVKPFVINEYSSHVWKDIEINCNLIYLFHAMTTSPSSPA